MEATVLPVVPVVFIVETPLTLTPVAAAVVAVATVLPAVPVVHGMAPARDIVPAAAAVATELTEKAVTVFAPPAAMQVVRLQAVLATRLAAAGL